MKVAHIVNYFDPACDVLRCVRELNRHSRYSHSLYVRDPHPLQDSYQYEQPPKPGWLMPPEEAAALIAEADVLIHHFTGWEDGIGDEAKPSAFRNINIYWDRDSDRFWSSPEYNAKSYDRYRLVASSHAGAADFMPADRFRWLPDLLPLGGDYAFDPAPRPRPAVSYIKHAEGLRRRDMGGAAHLDCYRMAHAEVLAMRRSLASVVIDNVCDGHYGLAGQEAAIMGLPVVVFNHPRTLAAMDGWEKAGTCFPFVQASTVDEAAAAAVWLARENSSARRHAIRAWAEEFFDPRRLVARYWDPFISELAS